METLENAVFLSLKQKALTLQLYKDLRFVRGFDDLKIHQVDELNLVYLTGHLPENNEQEVFFPLAADEAISLNRIAVFQNHLLQHHNSKRLTLALIDADSTTVYFCITPGLLPPSELESKK
ncbi:uncharacterized protein LOC116926076 [Daphnia magna]|uniref:tRNA-splicing endonuclease subunit Sen15 domain-containing protein n=1 Tax=Daphnia magna TaxID=35525 RepID=A0ABR0AJT4_9CRUS|nr:uncharacterized protein LOC116926076 [Daphnia magna]KAK4025243.1 hypothetical protein OUZ56_014318 [Daphnia magna]